MNLQLRSFFRSSRTSARRKKTSRSRRVHVESLESRALLAADSYPSILGTIGKLTYFKSNDGVHGEELWRTDGTTAGTKLVKDINPGPNGSRIIEQAVFDGKLYFSADDGVHGSELWSSDGTNAGTKLVKETLPDFYGGAPTNLTVFKGSLFFSAWSEKSRALWKSDGTRSGTKVVKDFDGSDLSGLRRLGDRLSFGARYESRQVSWTSDGTTKGTKPEDSSLYYTEFGDTELYFRKNSAGGYGMFQSKDSGSKLERIERNLIRPGGHFLGGPFIVGQQAIFTVYNPGIGSQLWRSDGTAKGTKVIRLLSQRNIGIFANTPSTSAVANNKFYFQLAAATSGEELWVTDGTSSGTKLIRDINPGTRDAFPRIVHASGKHVFFFASNPDFSRDLWRTDGTAKGTVRVADYNGKPLFQPGLALTPAAAEFVFAGYDPEHGVELWKSDGTAGGTGLLKDIAQGTVNVANSPSSGGSLTGSITISGGTLNINSAGTLNLGSGSLTVGGGTIRPLGSSGGTLVTSGSTGAFTGSLTKSGSGNLTLRSGVLGSGNLSASNVTANLSLAGSEPTISNSGTSTVNFTGNLPITLANSNVLLTSGSAAVYAGTTVVNGGTLSINSNGNVPVTLGSLTTTANTTRTLTIGSGLLGYGVLAASNNIVLVPGSTGVYTGATVLNGGTLTINSLGTFNGPTALNSTGISNGAATVTLTPGVINAGTGTLLLNPAPNFTTVGGTLTARQLTTDEMATLLSLLAPNNSGAPTAPSSDGNTAATAAEGNALPSEV